MLQAIEQHYRKKTAWSLHKALQASGGTFEKGFREMARRFLVCFALNSCMNVQTVQRAHDLLRTGLSSLRKASAVMERLRSDDGHVIESDPRNLGESPGPENERNFGCHEPKFASPKF